MSEQTTNRPGAPVNPPTGRPATEGTPAAPKRERKTRPEVKAEAIEVMAIKPGMDMANFRVQRAERSKAQKMIDQIVKEAHAEWVAVGAPQDWLQMPGRVLPYKNEGERETLMFMIRKAGQHYGLKIRFGRDGKVNGKNVVAFAVLSRPAGEAPEPEEDDDLDETEENGQEVQK